MSQLESCWESWNERPAARGVGIGVAFGSARLRARGKVLIKEGYHET
jgi:hypothetical protein